MPSLPTAFRYKTFIFILMFSLGAWAATPRNRITQAVDTAQWVSLRSNAHPLARPQFDRGRLAADQQISGSVDFKLSPAQQADLDTLLAQQQDPASANYHKWLTPEQYATRFGLSKDDLAKVSAWLQSQGLSVTHVSRGGTAVFFTGTAGQAEYAFHTELRNYSVNGKMQYANASAPSVPAAMAGVVLGIRGLDNFRPKAHNSLRNVRANFTSSTSGNHFMAPEDFATIYNVKGLYSAGFDGTGQKLAIVGQTLINASDMDAFRSAAGLSKNDPQLVPLPGSGTGTVCSGDIDEANLDVEWSGAVAKNASILFVYTGVDTGKTCDTTSQNVFNSLQYAIDNDLAPVISTSYGFCEAGTGQTTENIFRTWVQQANSQGQTVMAASGDSGAADCDDGTTATNGLAVDTPASIPEVTGLGGTEFSGDVSSPSTYWNATNDSNNGSAISYIPETTWNDTTNDIANGGGLSASGGGASIFFSKPSWQTGTGVPADGKRDVPDVALDSSADHDGYLICSQGNCTSGFRNSSGGLSLVGGTSVAAPSFAGIVSLINEATNSTGLGNINPTLYTLAAGTPAAFHDVTTGDNKVPCTKGSTDCPNGGSIGFTAGTGYDQVTGLGSVDALQLATAWPGFSSFTVASNPTSLSVTGGQPSTTALTITSTNDFSGTVDLTCSSSGTRASCTISPSSVMLSSTATSGSATLNITTTSANVVGATSADNQHSLNWLASTAGLGLVSIFLLAGPSKRRNGLMILCLAAFLTSAIGCGGGTPKSSSNNTSGNVTLTVTATSGNVSRTTTVAVTVQ